MKTKMVLYLVAAFGMAAACSGKDKKGDLPPRPDVSAWKGKCVERVVCRADSNLSYALYLPSNYDTSGSWPVIIAFDSHADGRLPVNLLAEEAEKNGYLVAGSNDSRNGMSTEATSAIFDALSADIRWRFRVDTHRVYVMGFSGGARVAAYQALYKRNIQGLIGCSAGFPNIQGLPPVSFDYLGIGGNDDFNLLEMKQLFQALDRTGIPHFLMTFDGTHAWPPKELVPDIFAWLQAGAMRNKQIPADTAYLGSLSRRFTLRMESLEKSSSWLKALEISQMADHFLRGFPQAATFGKHYRSLSVRPEVVKALNEQQSWMGKEQGLQETYLRALQEKDLNWWKQTVAEMDRTAKKAGGSEESHVYKRLSGYLSLACYSRATAALKAGEWEPFRSLAALYGIIDPENSEAAYLQAVAGMKEGNKALALEFLQKAADLGFKDATRLEADSSFLPLHSDPGYQDILKKMTKH